MPIHRKINKNFFKYWTPDMAYVFGFICADGNIVHTKRDTWFWSLQINDKEILEQIKVVLCSSHVISKRVRSNPKHKQSYRFQVGSKDMCTDLLNLGLTECKSRTILLPEIPQKYFPDFVRGYFDGDGGVWAGFKNRHRKHKIYAISAYFTSGSKRFLISLKDVLSKSGLLGGSLVEKERGFDLKYSINDSLILYKIMYNKGCRLFLKRKRDKFESYIKQCGRSSTG